MVEIRNISSEDIVLIGTTIPAGTSRSVVEIGSRYRVTVDIDEILSALLGGVIKVERNGMVVSNTADVVSLLTEGEAAVDQYYFVKEVVSVNRGTAESRRFLGGVNSITVVAKSGAVEVAILTGSGLVLQIEEVRNRQELILHCDYKLQDPTLVITTRGRYRRAAVELFIDGSSTASVEDIQTVIREYGGQ